MAVTKRFTKAVVQSLNPREKLYEVRDSEVRGLTLRVTPTGVKTWVLVRWVRPNTERIKIGRWPDLSIKAARDAARVLIGRIATGDKPADQRRAARAESTLGELWVAYLQKHARPNKRSWRNDELQYQKHLQGWERRRLSSITRRDVTRLRDQITAKDRPKGGPIAGNRVLALLSSMWGWAVREQDLQLPNPCYAVKREREVPRDRYLTAPELPSFLRGVREYKLASVRDAVLLLLFTGQRKATVLGLRWADVDLKHRLWTIPAADAKAGRAIEVPLVPEVVEILRRRRAVTKGKATAFSFPASGIRHHFEKLVAVAELQHGLTPHDLRRTLATWMIQTGAGMEVVGKLLGHAPQGITATVYAHVNTDQVRRALERTVRAMLAAADATEEEAKVVKFPVAGVPARG